LIEDVERKSRRGFTPNSFEFEKRRQRFIGAHNEPLSVTALCVCNPDRSPVGIQRLTEIAQVHGFFSSQSFWKAKDRNSPGDSIPITC
jgi:hypothetical protein